MPQFTSREKQPVPEVQLRIRRNGEWVSLSTRELFAGRNIVVFALPGAFTPTCSSEHLPRYDELEPAFRAHGIDEVVCVSVNDPYVMEEWGRDQGCRHVTLLPDGNGEFTREMGMLIDKSDLNFGKRSWRYSMLVRDRIIEKMFIEPDEPGDPFHVSDADTMLEYLDPGTGKPDQVALLTREGCPFCARAKQALQQAGIDYADVPLGNPVRAKALGAIANAHTVPQVFVNGRLLGDSQALEQWLQQRRAAGAPAERLQAQRAR